MGFHRGDLVELIYMDESGRLSQRHVRVLSVKDGKLVAYCFLRRKLRCFSTEGILAFSKKSERPSRRTAI